MENMKYEEEFILNSRGLKLFTCRWLPFPLFSVGYGVECSITMRGTGIRLAKAGYAVYGIDYVGHGKSSGLQAYIPSFDQLVNDCSEHFTCISGESSTPVLASPSVAQLLTGISSSFVTEKIQYKNKMRYLLGESMGGAVALLLHCKKPKYWDGAILVAPMCKIAEKLRPHPFVIRVLRKLSKVIPTWKIVPTQDIIDMAFKNPEKRKEIRSNPYCYKGKPRLRTAQQLLTVSLEIEKKLDQVTMPFLIVHGEADTVTDPEVSKLLYNSASSTDKTLKMYPSMWHALTSGESPEDIEHVFSDIVAWLDERSEDRSSRSEKERNAEHDDQFPDSQWKTIEIEG
ncbi:caffeoylshikimate esterase-like [Aristolochia californica]|uniref:caffeoylshikimate esterase-like n=1 Tax=Aristolochia californica TaxID=171875 RepID=UPI0035E20923